MGWFNHQPGDFLRRDFVLKSLELEKLMQCNWYFPLASVGVVGWIQFIHPGKLTAGLEPKNHPIEKEHFCKQIPSLKLT